MPTVFNTSLAIAQPDREKIRELIDEIGNSSVKSSRLILHQTSSDPLHQMIIAHEGGMYIQPHINQYPYKSWHVVRGELMFMGFSSTGQITKKLRIGTYDSGLPFIVRLAEKTFHTLIPISPKTVIVETVQGPFYKTIYAEWAPSPNEKKASQEYFKMLCQAASLIF